MKKTLLFFTALISISVYSQVGINTETPKATLDVVGNPTNAAKVDGVIIPRITGNELKAKDALYGADQTGTIIYATAAASPTSTKTAEITAAGFYYFNGSIWKTSGSAGDTSIYTHDGTVTAGANRTVTIPNATNVNFNGFDSGSFYAWTDSGDIGLFGYEDFGKISLTTAGTNADIKVRTTGTDSYVLLQPDSADKNVGIGTILPTAKLHTNGTVRLENLATTTANTNYLTTDANGNVTRTTIPIHWNINGNAGTTAGTNFLGTTDNVDLIFKRNNIQAGWLGNSTAAFNTAFGTSSLPTTTTGTNNSAFGVLALGKNTTGSNNVAFGTSALAESTTASQNSAFGVNAMGAKTTGGRNDAFGYNALANLTTGTDNAAFGHGALQSMITGGVTTAFGVSALANTTASYSSAFGYQALMANTTGYGNTAFGYQAMLNNTTGGYNTVVGINALNANTTGNDHVAIGYHTLFANTTGAGNVGVGNGALVANTTGGNNTAVGFSAGQGITTGSNNTVLGNNAGSNITTGSNNIAIGNGSTVPTATASNQIRLGNTAITYAGVQVAWTVTSDKRWKKDIKNSDLGLNFIKQLRPVSYIRKNDDSKKLEYGFIAQELQETLKKNNVTNSGIISEDDEKMLSVRYNDFFAPMVKAVQDQQKIIERQKILIDELQKRINALEKK